MVVKNLSFPTSKTFLTEGKMRLRTHRKFKFCSLLFRRLILVLPPEVEYFL